MSGIRIARMASVKPRQIVPAGLEDAEISTPHPKAPSELGYLAYRVFAQADATVRMIVGMDTNTSAAAAIAVPATTIVVVV
jgi:hypothetical protein